MKKKTAGDGCFNAKVEPGYYCCPAGLYPHSCGCANDTFASTCSNPSRVFKLRGGVKDDWAPEDGPLPGADVCREICGDGQVLNETEGVCDDGRNTQHS
jgi:hypothetical protein